MQQERTISPHHAQTTSFEIMTVQLGLCPHVLAGDGAPGHAKATLLEFLLRLFPMSLIVSQSVPTFINKKWHVNLAWHMYSSKGRSFGLRMCDTFSNRTKYLTVRLEAGINFRSELIQFHGSWISVIQNNMICFAFKPHIGAIYKPYDFWNFSSTNIIKSTHGASSAHSLGNSITAHGKRANQISLGSLSLCDSCHVII